MKYIAQVPTAQYAYIQCQSDDLKEVIDFHNKLSDVKIEQGEYKTIKTFTNETILYDKEQHRYTDVDGNKLISGSEYASKFEKPFPKDIIAGKSCLKHNLTAQEVIDQWDMNGELSRQYGNTVHLAMEYYFKHHNKGSFNLPKHPTICDIIEDNPLYMDKRKAHAEVFISDVKNKMCGIVDLILEEEKDITTITIVDYKTSYDIKKNLPVYSQQLNYYSTILENKGFVIKERIILNYCGSWETIKVGKEPIDNKLK